VWRLLAPLALALNLGLAAQWAVRVAGALLRGPLFPFDFPALYAGWALALQRPGARLYDLAAQASGEAHLLGRAPYAGGVLPFAHPPHAALLLAPLGWLPVRGALWLWTAIQLGLLALVLREVRRRFAGRAPVELWLAVSVVLAFPPVWVSIWFGQISLVVLGAWLVLAAALEEKRDDRLAVALVVISCKPQLLPFALLAVALRRRWRALAFFAAGLAVLALASELLLGAGVWRGFFALGRRLFTEGCPAIPVAEMENLRGMLARRLGSAHPLLPALSLAATAAGALIFGVGRRLKPLALVAVAAWLGAFLSPHLFLHDEGLYLLAAGLVCLDPGRWSAAALALLPALYQLTLSRTDLRAVVVLGLGALVAARLRSPEGLPPPGPVPSPATPDPGRRR
jgi:hypothetical protein